MGKKVNLKVLPDNYNKEVEAGSRLMDAINENNISIESTCGSKGKCGKCKVKLLEGKISNITENEKKLLSEKEIDEKIVFACERTVLGDITIEIINENKDMVEKGQIIKSNKNINPIVEKIYLELPLP
ncbi:MAG: 2Fe-2S iron-sulfur cluster-binding protein [Terrisporobacter othiniensis]|uniref:2Fe-2S iron-sulfur cluster-binding protein n=1 Tax=Terrisporobacter othiniensis TaxID=1577792 RepID=UPI000938DA2D|nr:2Fe-2S iron-sulfur cluster-binding protein [Terrisporobacter othiniensis]MDU6983111.1 2Fe-2S iron-sulfur cluster-binding protein [Terrisporobacter othiniensis]